MTSGLWPETIRGRGVETDLRNLYSASQGPVEDSGGGRWL